MCEQQCQALLEQKQSLTGVAFEIRSLMLKYGMQISMEFVAQKMSMTSRTLHRQLKTQNTSWRAIRDSVRCAMAEELLSAGNIQLEEIAERLGFSDGANFSHAFKRWRGVSPLQFKKASG
jgi:AraC-like DNA-binding protein